MPGEDLTRAPTPPKCNVSLEEGEAVACEGCNILIAEHCILQRGPRPHENSLDCGEPRAVAPVPHQSHAKFRAGSDHGKCRITLLRDWVERAGWCHHNPLLGKCRACLVYFFFPFFFPPPFYLAYDSTPRSQISSWSEAPELNISRSKLTLA